MQRFFLIVLDEHTFIMCLARLESEVLQGRLEVARLEGALTSARHRARLANDALLVQMRRMDKTKSLVNSASPTTISNRAE